MRSALVRLPGCRTTVAWIVLCLLVPMTGCATRPMPHPALPPLPMLAPRPIPEWSGRTYRDLLVYSTRLREAAQASEADKAAARALLDPAAPSQP